MVSDAEATAALVSDLLWQIDQLEPRGIKDNTGGPYDPAYYKRGLKAAMQKGGTEVAEFVRKYLYKPPSDGFKKLKAGDALDLSPEYLVTETDKPYAHLFTDEDRAAAEKRLAPQMAALQQRKADSAARIEKRSAELPGDVDQLREIAAETTVPEEAIAVNAAIVALDPEDVVALNRLGRAHAELGQNAQAEAAFRDVLAVDPKNSIALGRIRRMTQTP